MAHVKWSVNAKKKRCEVLDSAKGYCDQHSRPYRKVKEQVLHSKAYEFRDRRHRKGQFRRLWIQRINAVVCADDITYNRLVQGLNLAGVKVDRKNLVELAASDPQTFVALVRVAKDALPENVSAPAVK